MSAAIPFVREMAFTYGAIEAVSPLIRRLVARNPSPFTFHGTGTYVVGQGTVAVIDPGPAAPDHVAALTAALAGETVSHILVTHTHLDHSPAAAALQAATGAPVLGFGPHGSGRPEPSPPVEEGADRAFRPDVRLRDGDEVRGPGWTLTALHTPGHTSNHLCFAFAEERALFTGDHVMGWSTTVIVPPDGDMGAYLASLERVAARGDAVLWPAHGPPVRSPQPFLAAYLAHRRLREAQVLACLEAGLTSVPEIVARLYADVPAALHPAAGRSVFAHLIHLIELGRVHAAGPPRIDGRFAAVQ